MLLLHTITHIFVLLLLLVVVVLVALLVISLVVEVFLFFLLRGWRFVVVARMRAVHARMGLKLSFFFPLHPTLGKLLHHLDKLFAVVFEQVVCNGQYATWVE